MNVVTPRNCFLKLIQSSAFNGHSYCLLISSVQDTPIYSNGKKIEEFYHNTEEKKKITYLSNILSTIASKRGSILTASFGSAAFDLRLAYSSIALAERKNMTISKNSNVLFLPILTMKT